MTAHKAILSSLLITGALAVAGIVFHFTTGVALIDGAWRGDSSFAFLNEQFAEHARQHPEYASRDHYQHMGRVYLSRALLLLLAAELLFLAWIRRSAVGAAVRNYLNGTSTPLNLAIFRIAIFSALLVQLSMEDAVLFSALPAEVTWPPTGCGWLAPLLVPFSPPWTGIAVVLLRIAAVSALIGLCTRTSALVAAVLACYVLGIPQFFGKVNHYHHLVWFPFLLAMSRSGDALSVDALIAAWRRTGRGHPAPPLLGARAYGLPLRIAWLIIGLCYFFPGFWKYWHSGWDWALSDNMTYQMYWNWQTLDGDWVPFFRIDRYPWLGRLGGVGTLFFEMGFVFCLFVPRLRAAAVLAGLGFHVSVKLFMNIFFWSMILAYAVFADWSRCFRWIGTRLFPVPLHVLYDGGCRLCRRTVALLRELDVLGRIEYIDALDMESLRRHGFSHLEPAALMRDMHVLAGARVVLGYGAYQLLARRIPLLWPLLPLLHLWPVTALGRRIYRRVADSRVCALPVAAAATTESAADEERRAAPSLGPLAIMGAVILAGSIVFGAREIVLGWPFACYPTFHTIRGPERTTLTIELVNARGEAQPLALSALKQALGSPRVQGMITHILETKDVALRDRRLEAFWRVCRSVSESGSHTHTVRVYRDRITVVPEDRARNPLARELLVELEPEGN